ncbi:MAG TPA: PQQ-binding-like beta-propeller repeat protein, partial [Azospirillaceae bacterium]|nr:PQQ-binding-like beta-propeller repeat protein [Azospirillaceae bacterium]
MAGRRLGVALGLAAALLCSTHPGPAASAGSDKAAVDAEDWPHYGRSSTEDHFSPLDQIRDANVQRLGLAWFHDLDTFDSYTAPLAVDGVVYFAVGHSIVHALDGRTGKLLWQHDPEVAKQAGHRMRAGWGIRGIAYKDGTVFTGTRDGRLIALDAKTGKLLWSVQTLDEAENGYITGPPWIAGDKVVIGFGGADYAPVRGYVTAYDVKTGRKAWRFHTVPGNPADGFESKAMEMAAKTWTGEWWKYGGGGTVWHAMAYDARFNRIYLGTGNGWPWNQKIRSP